MRCGAIARKNAAWCSAPASATSRARRSAIAHMGHVNAPMILGTLGVIEVGLNALDIPHGKGGTGAAIEYLGESVSA